MMRFSLLFVFVFLSVACLKAQDNAGKVWLETGVQGKVYKDLSWGLDLTTRYGNYGLETFFPQLSFKYKVTKWFRPSIDYRVIGDREYFDERYTISQRLNVNAEFKHVMNRISLKSRIRYQFALAGRSQVYEAEFDQALRLKLEGQYDIDNFFLSPTISGELFYNPSFGENGQRFNKYRIFAGVESDFKGPHSFSVGYMFDGRMNVPDIRYRHVLSLGYTYEIEFKKGKGDDKKEKD